MPDPDENAPNAVAKANARAWDAEAATGNKVTVPLTDDEFRDAARQNFPVSLTGSRPLPDAWLGDLTGRRVLCIACGGGQQAVLLGARGAVVTSLENSREQLQRDVDTCAKFGLDVVAVEGSMDEMDALPSASFDAVVLGMGAQFVPDLRPVFTHVRRLLTTDGFFVGAFVNPVSYVFDWEAQSSGRLVARHRVPYSDLTSLPEDERLALFGPDAPLEFGHSLEEIFGGLVAEGLVINGYVEEFDVGDLLAEYFPSFFAVRACSRD